MHDGAYPAPASPSRLQERRWFCLEHVREYNRTWNFYAHMTPEQMERERRRDTVWQRPTWPFSRLAPATSRPKARQEPPRGFGRMPETRQERLAVAVLGLIVPYTRQSLKACYRAKAKTAHPDVNPDKPNAEERFKRLREAYMTLLAPLTK
jgi:hypothetical protein